MWAPTVYARRRANPFACVVPPEGDDRRPSHYGCRADLRTPARIRAGSAPGDWTRRLPAADVHDHDGYFVPDTSALRAMALIAAGHVHEASRHPGRLGPVAAAQPAAAVRPGR
jgi:hypothetical protein